MLMRYQAIAAVTAAAFALSSAASAPAFAGTTPQVKPVATEQAATDFSARKRHRSYRNDAAAAAMVGAIVSGITAYAAAREYRKARERSYYGYGPRYRSYAPSYGYRSHYRSHGYPHSRSHSYSNHRWGGTSSWGGTPSYARP